MPASHLRASRRWYNPFERSRCCIFLGGTGMKNRLIVGHTSFYYFFVCGRLGDLRLMVPVQYFIRYRGRRTGRPGPHYTGTENFFLDAAHFYVGRICALFLYAASLLSVYRLCQARRGVLPGKRTPVPKSGNRASGGFRCFDCRERSVHFSGMEFFCYRVYCARCRGTCVLACLLCCISLYSESCGYPRGE